MKLSEKFGKALASYLAKPISCPHIATCSAEHLAGTIQKGDVLLVDGDSRFSATIRYLTQSIPIVLQDAFSGTQSKC
jgi:hypothetical protein